eukprot:gene3185-5501_t
MSIFSKEGQGEIKKTLERGMSFFHEERETFNVICVGADPSEKDRVLKQFAFAIGGDSRSRLEEIAIPYVQYQLINILHDLVEATKKFEYEIDSKYKNSIASIQKYKDDFHATKELKMQDFVRLSSIVEDDSMVKTIFDSNYKPELLDIMNTEFSLGNFPVRFDSHGNHVEIVTLYNDTSRNLLDTLYDEGKMIMFVVSLTGYDLPSKTNQDIDALTDALNTVHQICKHSANRKKGILILYTNRDEFKQKIEDVELSVCKSFKDFETPKKEKSHAAFKAIRELFAIKAGYKKRRITHKVATSKDELDLQVIYRSLAGIILEEVLVSMNMK